MRPPGWHLSDCQVVLVVTQLISGGKERVVAHLAREFHRRGVGAAVVCLTAKGLYGEELEGQGLKVICLDSRRGWDAACIVRLSGLLRHLRPRVINVHDRSSLPYVTFASWLCGRRPIVFTAHGFLFGQTRPRSPLEAVAWRAVNLLVAVSSETVREYCELLSYRGPVRIIDNGVEIFEDDGCLRKCVRRELGISSEAFVFLGVGNLNPEKGFEDLLTAARLLVDRCPGHPFRVLIAGGTQNQCYYEALKARVERDSLQSVVRFVGFRNDVRALYCAADAFVLSSRKEGLPMVLLEAMGAGLPVVATRVGAVPHVIADGVNGLLADPGKPEDLARQMRRLMIEDASRLSLAQHARHDVRNHYGVARMADDYLAAYASVCSRGRTGPGGR